MNELKIIKSIVSWILFVAFLFVVPWSSLFFYLRSKLFQWEKQKNKLLQNSTNDCLYFVTTPDGWRIALTHYPPSNSTSSSNSNKHKKFPVLLCHGLSANRITFDMGPEPFPSLARYLSDQGFEVYCLELRGSNLSFHPGYKKNEKVRQFDFDDLLQMDFSSAIDFILKTSNSPKVHIIGHSMGGILSLAYLSENQSKVASCISVASALSYAKSGTRFEKFLGLEKIAKSFPRVASWFVPHGQLTMFVSELVGYFSNPMEEFLAVSSNMDPHVFRHLYKYGFHSIPLRLMLQLATGIKKQHGIENREGNPYSSTLESVKVPILMLGGSRDAQCPVKAVENSARLISSCSPTVKLFGLKFGQEDDYGHFDLLIGKRAHREVFPSILSHLNRASVDS